MSKSPKDPAPFFTRICSPSHLRSKRTSPTVATLSWVDYSADCRLCPKATAFEISGEGIATFEVKGQECEVRNLKIDCAYRLAVRAKASGNIISDPSYVMISEASKGPEPRNVRISANAGRRVSIAWDPPQDHTPIGYDVILLGKAKAVTEPFETLYNMTPGILIYIGVRTRLPAGNVSVIVYIPVIPKL